jgi:hypothetical protein
MDGAIEHTVTGTNGVLCRLRVDRPGADRGGRSEQFWHAYLVSDGRIIEIRRYDDESSGVAAISQ